MIDTYSAALAFIHGRTQFKKAPTLSRMRQFLHELGDPQLKVAGIHVAGTNGKGRQLRIYANYLWQMG